MRTYVIQYIETNKHSITNKTTLMHITRQVNIYRMYNAYEQYKRRESDLIKRYDVYEDGVYLNYSCFIDKYDNVYIAEISIDKEKVYNNKLK